MSDTSKPSAEAMRAAHRIRQIWSNRFCSHLSDVDVALVIDREMAREREKRAAVEENLLEMLKISNTAANREGEALSSAETEVAELRKALADIEWSHGQMQGNDFCPRCGRHKDDGHNRICELAAVLARTAPKEPRQDKHHEDDTRCACEECQNENYT